MKHFFIKKEITASLFIIILVLFSIVNCVYSLPIDMQEIESSINNSLLMKTSFIESYGFMQSVLEKRELNNFEVLKDNNDMLYLTSHQFSLRNVSQMVSRMHRLKETVESNNGQLITLIPPDKILEKRDASLDGYPYSYNNETADAYKEGLKNISVLDYRDIFLEKGLTNSDVFFKTDHHWKIETAFQAFQELVDYLNKKDSLKLDPQYYYRDLNNYNQFLYKDSYIGSIGRKTGKLYGGVEDYTLIYPNFETSFEYDMQHYGEKTHRAGRMDDTLINPHYFKIDRKDYLNPQYDFYSAYLDYNCSYAKIVNKNNPDGLKVVFYKDSYSMPLITFFSTVCSEIEIIDPRYYDKDINKYFEENKFDYVFVSMSPDLLYEDSFIFYK
ncbi:MAG: hypothetical protein RR630_07100 [Coprobacillus sp.]